MAVFSCGSTLACAIHLLSLSLSAASQLVQPPSPVGTSLGNPVQQLRSYLPTCSQLHILNLYSTVETLALFPL
jgi:hypothetical protein